MRRLKDFTRVLIPSSSGLVSEPPKVEIDVTFECLNPFFFRAGFGTKQRCRQQCRQRVLIPSSSGLVSELLRCQ